MLRNKSNYSRQTQDNESHRAPNNPSSFYVGDFVQAVSVSELFPRRADNVSSHTTVATCEIAGPDQTLTDKAAFGQVLGFCPTGHEAGIPGRCWCSPSPDDSLFGFQGECVFCVNSANGTEVQIGLPKDVVYQNSRVRNTNTRIPKKNPRQVSQPQVDPHFCDQHLQWFSSKSEDSYCSEGHCQHRHDLAGSRTKGLGFHDASLTQPSAEGRYLR